MLRDLVLAAAAAAALSVTTPQGARLVWMGPVIVSPEQAAVLRAADSSSAAVHVYDTRADRLGRRCSWQSFLLETPDTGFVWPEGLTVFANLSDSTATIAFEQLAVDSMGRAIPLAGPVHRLAGTVRRRQLEGAEGYVILVAFPRDLTAVRLTRLRIGTRAAH
jgi:hypothetical protein